MKLISIIIPAYNHRDAILESLRTIASQHYPHIEVIIVDDGSDTPVVDDIEEISELFKKRDIEDKTKTRLTFLQQENSGAPSARNKGFGQAKGEYIIFWDADVIAKRDMLKKMHNVLTLHAEVDYCYSSFTFGNKKMPGQKFDLARLKENNYIHSTSLIRKEAVVKWDESLK